MDGEFHFIISFSLCRFVTEHGPAFFFVLRGANGARARAHDSYGFDCFQLNSFFFNRSVLWWQKITVFIFLFSYRYLFSRRNSQITSSALQQRESH